MQITTFMQRMGRNDAKLIGRDQFMIGLVAYPLLNLLVLRYGIPRLTDWAVARFEFDLVPYYTMIVSYALMMMIPMFMGMIFGLLLIEERDDDTLTVMMVTPVSLDRFVLYRIVAAVFISFAMIILFVPNVGIIDISFWQLLPISLIATLVAPLTALLFFSLASNKVQAFGVLKALSTLNLVPAIAWFVAEPWQWLFGLYPPYWALKAFWVAVEGQGHTASVFAVAFTRSCALPDFAQPIDSTFPFKSLRWIVGRIISHPLPIVLWANIAS